jgi:hypothetical protein
LFQREILVELQGQLNLILAANLIVTKPDIGTMSVSFNFVTWSGRKMQ